MGRSNFWMATTGLIGIAAASPAWAQESGQGEEVSFGEIIVTAQRREQSLQDVPISITAISGDQIDRMAIDTPSQLIAHAPNVNFQMPTGALGFPIFNIRGVTLLDFSDSNEASVAVYSDDVYLGSPAMQNQTLFDVERVEILRGPQGTLYGRNATGGLVNFISRRPSSSFEDYVSGRFGSDDEYVVEAALSGPIAGDVVRARIAGRTAGRDGWQRNAFNGNRLGGVDENIAIRALVEIEPSPDWLLTANFHYGSIEGDEDGRAFFGAAVPGSAPAVRCAPAQILASQCSNAQGFIDPDPRPDRVWSEEDSLPVDVENIGGWFRIEGDLGFAQLTSITSYDHVSKLDTLDADQSPSPAGRLTLVYDTTHEQYSQELRLSGESDLIDWIVGGYYYHDTRFFTATLIRLGGNGSWADQTVETGAVFGQVTIKPTPDINLTAGLRYTVDNRELGGLARIASGGVPGTRLGTQLYLIQRELDTERVTWRLAADWHFAPDQMVYASVSTGFKSGAFNTLLPSTNSAAVVPADPESITAYEVGVRGRILDGLATYSIAAFFTDYHNIQAQGTLANPTPVSSLDTIGDGAIYGLEAELTARPVDGLSLSFGMGLLDTKIETDPGFLFNGTAIDGNRLVMAPSVSVNGTIRYEAEIGGFGTLYAAADARYQSRVYFGPDNLPTETQPGYGLVNADIGLILPSGNTEIGAFVRNLTDTTYFVHGVDSGGATQVGYQWGRPRTWGVRVRQSF